MLVAVRAYLRVRHTDDKIDLRAKAECQVFVAHELVHFNGLDDPVVSNALDIDERVVGRE